MYTEPEASLSDSSPWPENLALFSRELSGCKSEWKSLKCPDMNAEKKDTLMTWV